MINNVFAVIGMALGFVLVPMVVVAFVIAIPWFGYGFAVSIDRAEQWHCDLRSGELHWKQFEGTKNWARHCGPKEGQE